MTTMARETTPRTPEAPRDTDVRRHELAAFLRKISA